MLQRLVEENAVEIGPSQFRFVDRVGRWQCRLDVKIAELGELGKPGRQGLLLVVGMVPDDV